MISLNFCENKIISSLALFNTFNSDFTKIILVIYNLKVSNDILKEDIYNIYREYSNIIFKKIMPLNDELEDLKKILYLKNLKDQNYKVYNILYDNKLNNINIKLYEYINNIESIMNKYNKLIHENNDILKIDDTYKWD